MIPAKVKIGYKEFDVQLVDYPILVGGKECYGSIDHNDYIIKINKTYKNNQQAATFLHEVLHGIDDMYLNGKLEEDDIEMLAKGLYMFFVDNQSVIKDLF
jgi:hypothetical protein